MVYKFEARTVQVGAVKSLIEALREILTETNIEISPKGIKIIATDPSVTILVHLSLDADEFDEYHCDETIIVGLNIINLFKLTRTMVNNDSLTLYIDKNKASELGIRIENEEYNKVTDYKLNTIDIDEDIIKAPPSNFSRVLTMPSQQFQKVCREAHNISDVIEIKSMDQQLIFSCNGDFASQETVYAQTTSGINFEVGDKKEIDEETIIQGYYLLKHLVLFSKCANLCQSIRMYLDNEAPLVIEFSVGSIGTLKLALAPQVED
jgi:proliferating cell nuclear antigen